MKQYLALSLISAVACCVFGCGDEPQAPSTVRPISVDTGADEIEADPDEGGISALVMESADQRTSTKKKQLSREEAAEHRLKLAKRLIYVDQYADAIGWLTIITDEYSDTNAAVEAEQLLEQIKPY